MPPVFRFKEDLWGTVGKFDYSDPTQTNNFFQISLFDISWICFCKCQVLTDLIWACKVNWNLLAAMPFWPSTLYHFTFFWIRDNLQAFVKKMFGKQRLNVLPFLSDVGLETICLNWACFRQHQCTFMEGDEGPAKYTKMHTNWQCFYTHILLQRIRDCVNCVFK